MADHSIHNQPWPNGTLVGVYPAEAQPAGQDSVPSGLAITSSTVAGGSVTFTGLTEGRRYLAYAGGAAKRFLVQPGSVDTLRPITGSEAQELRGDLDGKVDEGVVPINLLASLVPFVDVPTDGVTDATAAIQARLEAGQVIYAPKPPGGSYVVNGTLLIDVSSPGRIYGDGPDHVGGTSFTLFKRTVDSGVPMLKVEGTGQPAAQRGHGIIEHLGLNGGDFSGGLLWLYRCNESYVNNVRLSHDDDYGLRLTEVFDANIDNVRIHNIGVDAADSGLLLDSVSDGVFGCTSNRFSNLAFEANDGTDIQLSGVPANSTPADANVFSNISMEGGTGSAPYIDLYYQQRSKFSNVNITKNKTGPAIKQVDQSAGDEPAQFANLAIESKAASSWLVEHNAGALQFANVSITGTVMPSTAIFWVTDNVIAGRFSITGLQSPPAWTILRFAGPYPGLLHLGKGFLPVPRMNLPTETNAATQTLLGHSYVHDFDAAVAEFYSGQVVLPGDALPGKQAKLRVLATANATTGNAVLTWNAKASYAAGDTGMNALGTGYTATLIGPDVAYKAVELEIAGPTVDPGDTLECFLQRAAANAGDTLAVDLKVLSLVVVYERRI